MHTALTFYILLHVDLDVTKGDLMESGHKGSIKSSAKNKAVFIVYKRTRELIIQRNCL